MKTECISKGVEEDNKTQTCYASDKYQNQDKLHASFYPGMTES